MIQHHSFANRMDQDIKKDKRSITSALNLQKARDARKNQFVIYDSDSDSDNGSDNDNTKKRINNKATVQKKRMNKKMESLIEIIKESDIIKNKMIMKF
ncbi:hypothetical protein DFA_11014 [Cavenderia fasciculata]|uniref:Uncharacterized protein n=1 Tax=Cavenderia fasciculata TaxID=261658 RepID=F4QC16_CACFS|nr:uncharacterized protein DFA_11014 [Cavenderia fasciculata]EGG14754.1 hypothetical protein DFA_11014 [Cavenderia fasciculata]|eukprot:XP_004351262.1 hypothetical protein DFA_11014 [Cavenderia fasciculata]